MKKIVIQSFLISLLGVGGIALAGESHDHGAATATANITATGTVKSVDATKGKLVIDHDPIPALNWPRMVMDFQLADKAMTEKVKVGEKINFTLAPGEKKGGYTVTAIEPAH